MLRGGTATAGCRTGNQQKTKPHVKRNTPHASTNLKRLRLRKSKGRFAPTEMRCGKQDADAEWNLMDCPCCHALVPDITCTPSRLLAERADRRQTSGVRFLGSRSAKRRLDTSLACTKPVSVVRTCIRCVRAVRPLTATWASFAQERTIRQLSE